jgi:exopolysaccharide biosynthesis protein
MAVGARSSGASVNHSVSPVEVNAEGDVKAAKSVYLLNCHMWQHSQNKICGTMTENRNLASATKQSEYTYARAARTLDTQERFKALQFALMNLSTKYVM